MPRQIDAHRLFVATVRVFGARGFHAMTTKEVARRAGTNEVTLFRRHGTKARLVVAALKYCLSKSPFANIEATDDVRRDLLAVCEAYAATNEAYGGAVFTLLDEVATHRELRGALVVLKQNLGRAAAIVAGHQARGRLAPGDPVQKLVFLFAPLMAAGVWQRAKVRGLSPEVSAASVVESFLRGHGAANVRPS